MWSREGKKFDLSRFVGSQSLETLHLFIEYIKVVKRFHFLKAISYDWKAQTKDK